MRNGPAVGLQHSLTALSRSLFSHLLGVAEAERHREAGRERETGRERERETDREREGERAGERGEQGSLCGKKNRIGCEIKAFPDCSFTS